MSDMGSYQGWHFVSFLSLIMSHLFRMSPWGSINLVAVGALVLVYELAGVRPPLNMRHPKCKKKYKLEQTCTVLSILT